MWVVREGHGQDNRRHKNHVWRLSVDVCVCVELNFAALGLLKVWQ